MPEHEVPIELFFGLQREDLVRLAEILVLSIGAFTILAVITTLIAYVISRVFEKNDESLGLMAFVVGGMSYIPFFGTIYGVSALFWGLLTRKRNGKVLAAVGAFTLLLTILSFHIIAETEGKPLNDELALNASKLELTDLLQAIEYFKLMKDRYPNSIDELENTSPRAVAFVHLPPLYYQAFDKSKKYYLLYVGMDEKPFTRDDILPNISISDMEKIGFRIKE